MGKVCSTYGEKEGGFGERNSDGNEMETRPKWENNNKRDF
jgi:hypothetical protein